MCINGIILLRFGWFSYFLFRIFCRYNCKLLGNFMTNSADNNSPAGYGFEDITTRFYSFVDNMGTRKVVYGIIWFVIAAALMVAASLPLPAELRWVTPIVGIPAGIILFALGLGIVHSTKLRYWPLFNVKEKYTQRRRVVPTLFGVGAVVAVLITSGSFIPTGVGGAIMVATALTAYNVIRRTPYEVELAKKGIPDPREQQYEEEEYYDEPEDDIIEDNSQPSQESGQEFRGRL